MCICKNCFSVIDCGENVCTKCGWKLKEEDRNCCELSELYYKTQKENAQKKREEVINH